MTFVRKKYDSYRLTITVCCGNKPFQIRYIQNKKSTPKMCYKKPFLIIDKPAANLVA